MKRFLVLTAALTMLFSCKSINKKADIETFNTRFSKVEVECIRHGSLAINFEGYKIMIDPVGEMDGKKTDYSKFGKVDAIFVTHEHFDHMDPKVIGQLSDEHTKIFANAAGCEQLGFGTALANGDKGTLNEKISYEVIPAYNVTSGHLQFHQKGHGNGYLFEMDGLRMYIAGDTEYIPEMMDLGEVHVAFLPCNQPYTMTVKMAADAAEAIRPQILVPYHLTDTNIEAIKTALDGSGIDVRLHESLR